MSEPITINGAVLSPRTLQMIASYQDENNEGLDHEISSLTDLMIEMIHLEFGDERNKLFTTIVADQLELLKSLKTN